MGWILRKCCLFCVWPWLFPPSLHQNKDSLKNVSPHPLVLYVVSDCVRRCSVQPYPLLSRFLSAPEARQGLTSPGERRVSAAEEERRQLWYFVNSCLLSGLRLVSDQEFAHCAWFILKSTRSRGPTSVKDKKYDRVSREWGIWFNKMTKNLGRCRC